MDECIPRSTFWRTVSETYDYAIVRVQEPVVELYTHGGVLVKVYEHLADHNVFCPTVFG